MQNTSPIVPGKVRTIPKSFSWIDRRIITGHFLHYLSKEEILLYYFLVTAANKWGMSFYSFQKICHALSLTETELKAAIRVLGELELIAFRFPFFQVLSLPEKPVLTKGVLHRLSHREGWK